MPILYGPLYQCPQCNQPSSFGRCMVEAKELTFRCHYCPCFRALPLPPITKKIIYLDQCAVSKMANPKNDPFWPALYERLTDLAAKNLIACPYSPMHVEESLLSIKLRNNLKAMYRSIGGDHHFNRPFGVEKAQLARSLKLFLGKPDPPEEDPLWRDWSRYNPNRWSAIFHVHVDFGDDEDSVQELRAAKKSFWERMKDQADEWTQNPKSFEEDVEANYTSWRTTLLKTRILIVNWLFRWVVMLNENEENPIGVVNEFFLSEIWKQTPFVYLWVRVWAKIAEMVRSPKGSRKPQLGDFYDAQVLPYYARYCDAMFLDNGYREIACDPRLDVKGLFGTRCYSERNREEFLVYLDEIEKAIPPTHKEALTAIHPPYLFRLENLVNPFAWTRAE